MAHGFHQSALDFRTRIVGMVEDTELRVSALAVQVEGTIVLLVEVHTPVDKFLNLLWRFPDNLFDGFAVGDVIAGDDGVGDMLVKGIQFHVGDRGHAALGKRGVCLFQRGLANHAYTAFVGACHLQCIAHSCDACTDDQKIIFIDHTLICY